MSEVEMDGGRLVVGIFACQPGKLTSRVFATETIYVLEGEVAITLDDEGPVHLGVDPRPGLATRERVPSADETVVPWPDELDVGADTAVVSLVHEERLDLPAACRGVEGGAFYVGALGSRRAQEKRREHLGETPAEIAAEILTARKAVRKGAGVPS